MVSAVRTLTSLLINCRAQLDMSRRNPDHRLTNWRSDVQDPTRDKKPFL